jgi:hypothetical protein
MRNSSISCDGLFISAHMHAGGKTVTILVEKSSSIEKKRKFGRTFLLKVSLIEL